MDLPQGDIFTSFEFARRSIKVLMDTQSSLKNVARDNEYLNILKALHKTEIAYMAMEKELAQVRHELSLEKDLVYESGARWSKSDASRSEPFCAACFESKRQAIHYKQRGVGAWFCPVCQNTYEDADYREPEPMYLSEYDPFDPDRY